MALSIGIVGLPNVGKSTLFSALTKNKVEIANYPFATIDPNVGIVEVPDERLQKLADLSHSKKIVPTVIEFVDIAGLVKGAHRGEGLGNKFLNHIREVDAMLYLVRVFEDANITHVEDSVEPERDMATIRSELALKDAETVSKRLDKVSGEARTGNKEAQEEKEILEKLLEALNAGSHIIEYLRQHEDVFARPEVQHFLKELNLLTAKPVLYVFNANTEELPSDLQQQVRAWGGEPLSMNIQEEYEGAGLSEAEREELGLASSVLPALIREAYRVLHLITFLTTGESETRAWTVREGSSAPKAAGVIHSDFEEKFIRAEVIQTDELLASGAWALARKNGSIRTEGKEYIVQDGDVMVFLHGA